MGFSVDLVSENDRKSYINDLYWVKLYLWVMDSRCKDNGYSRVFNCT